MLFIFRIPAGEDGIKGCAAALVAPVLIIWIVALAPLVVALFPLRDAFRRSVKTGLLALFFAFLPLILFLLMRLDLGDVYTVPAQLEYLGREMRWIREDRERLSMYGAFLVYIFVTVRLISHGWASAAFLGYWIIALGAVTSNLRGFEFGWSPKTLLLTIAVAAGSVFLLELLVGLVTWFRKGWVARTLRGIAASAAAFALGFFLVAVDRFDTAYLDAEYEVEVWESLFYPVQSDDPVLFGLALTIPVVILSIGAIILGRASSNEARRVHA
ncbi:MAG: hypothetical protein VR70_12305 [Rhodospirillaceae bacterium BRH_c57]|nr:MAG: hypothetical protein VR70_12305 [Rhodospirillaceae bacterium BRH_c57]